MEDAFSYEPQGRFFSSAAPQLPYQLNGDLVTSEITDRSLLRGQTYSILGLASILKGKTKTPENLICSGTQAVLMHQEGPHGLSMARVTP